MAGKPTAWLTVSAETIVQAALGRFRDWCAGNGFAVSGEARSELTGAGGNQEFFFHLKPQVS